MKKRAPLFNAEYGALSFSYDVRLALKTSISGKDLMFTRLRPGIWTMCFQGFLNPGDWPGMFLTWAGLITRL